MENNKQRINGKPVLLETARNQDVLIPLGNTRDSLLKLLGEKEIGSLALASGSCIKIGNENKPIQIDHITFRMHNEVLQIILASKNNVPVPLFNQKRAESVPSNESFMSKLISKFRS
ncbi:hypothetical protein HOC67_05040 [Candidatus Peregrinibacteria bacterium]|jgi:hypothetical protein|nr:hypothetical protein [Candidatus Peregrinibacteria bacterium]